MGPSGAGCSPRPPVSLSFSPGTGVVVVSATQTTELPNNVLAWIAFGPATNARIDVGAATGLTSSGQISLNTQQVTFHISAIGVGGSMVPFTVRDACGDWPSFVGAGTGQPLPTRTPTPTPTANPVIALSANNAAVGGDIRVTWSGIWPAWADDWFGLYTLSAADSQPSVPRMYVNCSPQAPTVAVPSGSCVYSIPGNLAPGDYQFRLYSHGGTTSASRLAVSATVRVYLAGQFADPGKSHAWGMATLAQYSVGFGGAEADVTAPTVTNNPGQTVAHVGVTHLTYYGGPFIEAGAMRDCSKRFQQLFGCPMRFYSSWVDDNTFPGLQFDDDVPPYPGGSYKFKVYYQPLASGLYNWAAYWCNGPEPCRLIAVPNLLTDVGMPYAASGGEATCSPCPIGNITTLNNKFCCNPPFVAQPNWVSYCYGRKDISPAGAGDVTACNTTNFGWTAHIP